MPIEDVLRWNNGSRTISSLGLGLKASSVDDDTVRDRTEKLFEADMLEKLKTTVCCWADNLTCTTILEHKQTVQEAACKMWDRACALADTLKDEHKAIADAERLELERQLCQRKVELNSIAGSTRNCFTAGVINRTLSDHAIQIAGKLGELATDAEKHGTEALNNAFQAKYNAFVEADALDFSKYMASFQLLRGACATVDETVNRDIDELTGTAEWKRSAGQSSTTSGLYQDDQDAIDAAGAAGAV